MSRCETIRSMMSRWPLFKIDEERESSFSIKIKDNVWQWVSDVELHETPIADLISRLDKDHIDMEYTYALQKMYSRLRLLILRNGGWAYSRSGKYLGSFEVLPEMLIVGSRALQEYNDSLS